MVSRAHRKGLKSIQKFSLHSEWYRIILILSFFRELKKKVFHFANGIKNNFLCLRGRSQITSRKKRLFRTPPPPSHKFYKERKILYLDCYKFPYPLPSPPKAWRNLRTTPYIMFWITRRRRRCRQKKSFLIHTQKISRKKFENLWNTKWHSKNCSWLPKCEQKIIFIN